MALHENGALHYACNSPAVYEEDVLLPQDERRQGQPLSHEQKRGKPRHGYHRPRAVAGVPIYIVRVILTPAQMGIGGLECVNMGGGGY